MHILCPHCRAFNRIADDKTGDARCGNCKADLFPVAVVALNDDGFTTIVQKAQQVIVVDFWASWCGPCRTMAPHFAQAATQRPQLHFVKVDVDQSPYAANQFQIRSVPTLVIIAAQQEIARVSGALPSNELLRWIDQVCKQYRGA